MVAPTRTRRWSARADKGAAFKLTGTAGDFWRVELDGRPGFIAKTAAQKSDGVAPAKVAWCAELAGLAAAARGQGGRAAGRRFDDPSVVDGEGRAQGRRHVRVRVEPRARRSIGARCSIARTARRRIRRCESFDADIPLWPGANVVTVVARESTQVQSQQTDRRRAARAARGARDARAAGVAARAGEERAGPAIRERPGPSRLTRSDARALVVSSLIPFREGPRGRGRPSERLRRHGGPHGALLRPRDAASTSVGRLDASATL